MEAESNRGFCNEDINSSMSRHAISFQHEAMNNSMSEMVPMGNYFGLSSSSGMIYSGNSTFVNTNPVVSPQAGGSSLLLDSVPGLKHDTGLAVEWSLDEQYKLEEGLANYENEPSIMKYIKIDVVLPDKIVRDVALRCRWLTILDQIIVGEPQCKPDLQMEMQSQNLDNGAKRKITDRLGPGEPVLDCVDAADEKPEDENVHIILVPLNDTCALWISPEDKPVELASHSNLHSAVPLSMSSYSPMSRTIEQSQRILYDGICGPMKQLMEHNAQVFNQITANLSTYKLQDNIDLF